MNSWNLGRGRMCMGMGRRRGWGPTKVSCQPTARILWRKARCRHNGVRLPTPPLYSLSAPSCGPSLYLPPVPLPSLPFLAPLIWIPFNFYCVCMYSLLTLNFNHSWLDQSILTTLFASVVLIFSFDFENYFVLPFNLEDLIYFPSPKSFCRKCFMIS